MMTLLNCFMPVFICVLRLIQQQKIEAEETRPELMTLLAQAQDQARIQGYGTQDIETASYALVVWADEAIMCAKKDAPHLWRQISLQQACYDSALGGYTFFEKLQALAVENNAVRLVYIFCLLCGFRGRYGEDDNLALEKIVAQQMAALPDQLKQKLFSHHAGLMPGNGERYYHRRRKYLSKISLAVSIAGLTLLYFLCNVWLLDISSYTGS